MRYVELFGSPIPEPPAAAASDEAGSPDGVALS